MFSTKKAKDQKAFWNSEVSDVSSETVGQKVVVLLEPHCISTESPDKIISATDAVIAVDNKPETSPYLSTPYTLRFGPNHVAYTILEAFLKQCPELAEKCKSKIRNKTIDLPDVNENIAHTLVHYLSTGTYQMLKSQNLADHAISVTEYAKNVHVYCVSRMYGLSRLQELSKQHAEVYEEMVPLAELLKIAENAFGTLPDVDIWLTNCLKKKMKVTLEADKFLFTTGTFLEHIGNVKRFDKTLVKCIAEIYAERDTPAEDSFDMVEVDSGLVDKPTYVENPSSEGDFVKVDTLLTAEPFTRMNDPPPCNEEASLLNVHACAENSPCPKDPQCSEDPACPEDPPCAKEVVPIIQPTDPEESCRVREYGTHFSFADIPTWSSSSVPTPETFSAQVNHDNKPLAEVVAVDDDRGTYSTPKNKKKGKKGKKGMAGGVQVEEPAVAIDPEPKPELEPEVEVGWAAANAKKDGKKGRKIAKKTYQTEAPVDDVPEKEETLTGTWDTWGIGSKKNKKSNRGSIVVVADDPIVPTEPEFGVTIGPTTADNWMYWDMPKDKGNAGADDAPLDDMVSPLPSPPLATNFLDLPKDALRADLEIPTDSTSNCARRAMHLQDDNLWSSCPSCSTFVKGLAERSMRMRI